LKKPCTKKYIELIRLELEDMKDDVAASEEILGKRFEELDVTNYVFMENMAILRSQMLGVENIEKYVGNLGEISISCDELRIKLEAYFSSFIKEGGFPEVIIRILKRKLDKIDKYMELSE